MKFGPDLQSLIKAYDAVIVGLAVLAGAMVAAVFLAIVYDVSVRTLGFQPPFWTIALTEYALLFMTMFAAPWLVRKRGHVFVESVVLQLGAAARRVVEKLVYIICIVLCLVLAYYATDQGLDAASRGTLDIRSITVPRWVLFAALPIGFGLSAIEFFRFLVGSESMYVSDRSVDSL